MFTTHHVIKTLFCGLCAFSLSACGSSASVNTAATPTANSAAGPNASAETLAEAEANVAAQTPPVGATRNTLTREQYVSAMACAAERAAPGSKFRFKSQWTAYQDASAQASWNQAMASGGDGQYIVYTQAVSLGCLGEG